MSNITKYAAPQPADTDEFKAIVGALEIQLEKLESEKQSVLDNLFAETLDADGCARYETMLGLSAESGDTLDDRRFRILTRLRGDLPYTLAALKNKLCDLCGAENVTVTLDAANYTLTVLIGLSAASQYNAAYELIQAMIPCNLVLNCSLKYNRYSNVKTMTWADAAKYTWAQLREDKTLQEG